MRNYMTVRWTYSEYFLIENSCFSFYSSCSVSYPLHIVRKLGINSLYARISGEITFLPFSGYPTNTDPLVGRQWRCRHSDVMTLEGKRRGCREKSNLALLSWCPQGAFAVKMSETYAVQVLSLVGMQAKWKKGFWACRLYDFFQFQL